LLTLKNIQKFYYDNEEFDNRIKFNEIISKLNNFVYGTKNIIKKKDKFISDKILLQLDISNNNVIQSLEYLVEIGKFFL
jgi:hypothetical protein